MGYHVKAEYTLNILHEPKSYDHVAQRFLCTGFILASRAHDLALKAILDGWQEINIFTADRIRFLFFVEGEETISGYPSAPSFTEEGFKKYHRDLVELASSRGFELSAQRGFQAAFMGNGKLRAWHPEEKVQKLAQQLGISSQMPCLAWVRDDAPGTIYVRSIRGLSPPTVISLVRQFTEEFYDNNVATLAKIADIETRAEKLCGDLEATIGEVDSLSRSLEALDKIKHFLKLIQDIPLNQREPAALRSSLEKLLGMVPGLPSISTLKEFGQVFKDCERWLAKSGSLEAFLQGSRDLPVPQAVSTYAMVFSIINDVPKTTPHVLPKQVTLQDSLLTAFRKQAEIAVSNEAIDPGLSRRISRLLQFLTGRGLPDEYEARLTTIVNIFVCLNGMIVLNVPESAEVWQRIRTELFAGLSDALSALVISVQLWIYSEFYSASAHFEARLRRNALFAEYSVEELRSLRTRVLDSLKQVGAAARSLSWTSLDGYQTRSIPGWSPSMLVGGAGKPDADRLIDQLELQLGSRLAPIGTIMREISAREVRPIADQLRALNNGQLINVIVSPGAEVGIAGTIVHKEDRRMSKIEVTLGDGNVFHGPFVIAERITDSFNKAEQAQVPDDLKSLLKQLVGETSKMAQSLPEEKAKDVSQDLLTLVTEASKVEPRKKWYEISSEGLVEAAKAVGAIGEPVIKTVQGILHLLTSGIIPG